MASDTMMPRLQLVWPDELDDLDLEPLQGLWTVEQYLALTNQTNRLIEFTDGVIEGLPMPTEKHQAISLFLLLALLAVVRPRGGAVFYAPLRLEIRPGKFREPDLVVLLDASDPRRQNEFWRGADLVIEIVSPDRPARDTEEKPLDYAEAGIPEYWIVNPLTDTLTVLTLDGAMYSEHGVFRRGERAASNLIAGLSVSVDDVLDAT
jgi:Uma2 family endonuclease